MMHLEWRCERCRVEGKPLLLGHVTRACDVDEASALAEAELEHFLDTGCTGSVAGELISPAAFYWRSHRELVELIRRRSRLMATISGK